MEKMKSEFERYMETDILGGYVPERVKGSQEGNKIMPVFRDAACLLTEYGIELHRKMIVGDRRFRIRSIFSDSKSAKTPTEQMLRIIDSDLKKDSI